MPKNVKQLQDELAAFVAAKDHEGVRRAYRGLLDLGQSRQEIMDEIICVSTSTSKLNAAPPDHLHLTKSGKQEDELPSVTARYLCHPVQVLRANVDGSRDRPVEESDRGIVRLDHKLSRLRRSRFPHRLRKLTLIAAGIVVFLSLGGLGFIHVTAPPPMATAPIATPPPMATAPIATPPPELTLVPGSLGPGWPVLDEIVGLTAFNGTSNAFNTEETPASDRLLDHDKPSTEKATIATLRHDELGSERSLSASTVSRHVVLGAKAAGGGNDSHLRKRRSRHNPSSRPLEQTVVSEPAGAVSTRAVSNAGTTGDIIGGPSTATCPNGYVLYISACYPAR